MKTRLQMMLAASVLGIAGLAATAPITTAAAQGFSISFNTGDVAFAYNDGYYDNNRRWHRWKNNNERQWFMKNHRTKFHAMNRDKDRERDRRWRDHDRDNKERRDRENDKDGRRDRR